MFSKTLHNLTHTYHSHLKLCLSLLISITRRWNCSLFTKDTRLSCLFASVYSVLFSLNIHSPHFSWLVWCHLLMPSSNVIDALSEALPFSQAPQLCTHCSLYIPLSYHFSCCSMISYKGCPYHVHVYLPWSSQNGTSHITIYLLLWNVNDLGLFLNLWFQSELEKLFQIRTDAIGPPRFQTQT